MNMRHSLQSLKISKNNKIITRPELCKLRSELMQFAEIRPAIATILATGWLEVQAAQDLQLIWALEQTLDPREISEGICTVAVDMRREKDNSGKMDAP